MLGTLGNPWKGSLAASWVLLLRFLFSEGVFTSADEVDAETVSPVGRSLGPLERFLGLGLEDEYLLWWRPPFLEETARPAAALGAWAEAADDSSDGAWGAAAATRRTESGSMVRFVAETSIDVWATVDRGFGQERGGGSQQAAFVVGWWRRQAVIRHAAEMDQTPWREEQVFALRPEAPGCASGRRVAKAPALNSNGCCSLMWRQSSAPL